MFLRIFPNLINLLSFITLATTVLLIVRGNLTAQVRVFALQSGVLAILAAVVAVSADSMNLLGVALVVALVKGWIIPSVLRRAVTKIGLHDWVAPYLSASAALVVVGLLVGIAFYVMGPVVAADARPTAKAIPLALAGVLNGFFVTVYRRRALTQILGFLMLENSIFLLVMLATYGVPFIVEMGIFLDVLVAVLISEVFIYRIKENFDSIDVDHLGALKG
ncbi:MAG: hypothetical protein HYR55_02425 [Acidobacteria bacterium]|nr:hypothetical protein [Acidobacteriota bacterium]